MSLLTITQLHDDNRKLRLQLAALTCQHARLAAKRGRVTDGWKRSAAKRKGKKAEAGK